jgi:hypothetical protein
VTELEKLDALMKYEQEKFRNLREKADRKLKKKLKLIDFNSDNNSKQQSKAISASVCSSVSGNHQNNTTTTSINSVSPSLSSA